MSLSMDKRWRPGKRAIATFLVLDDEFVWAHSVSVSQVGRLSKHDKYYGGADVYDLQGLESLGRISMIDYLYFDEMPLDK